MVQQGQDKEGGGEEGELRESKKFGGLKVKGWGGVIGSGTVKGMTRR